MYMVLKRFAGFTALLKEQSLQASRTSICHAVCYLHTENTDQVSGVRRYADGEGVQGIARDEPEFLVRFRVKFAVMF